MSLNSFVSFISSLNNGSVIYGTADTDSEIILGVDNVKLYRGVEKYYFLAEYTDNYNEIEKNIKDNKILKNLPELRPNNSYLTLLYKVEHFSDDILKKVIQIEENEFFYKKYVFYYSESELRSFNEWFSGRKDKNLTSILHNEDCSPESEKLYMQFLLRLVIKLPFLRLNFKKMELDDFDVLVEHQLNGVRTATHEIKHLYSRLCNELEVFTPEKIAETLFGEILKGDKDENKIN